MNETDLKYAMRGAMDAAGGRPPMDEVAVLDAAKRAERRRGALLAGGVSAVAVAGIAIAAVALYGNSTAGTVIPAAPGDPTAVASQPEETRPSWPNGQTDRTATNGPRADQGVVLLDALTAARPAGFDAPTDLTYDPALGYVGEPRMHEAQFVDRVGGTEVWEYRATAPVAAGGGVGKLYAEVYTPGSDYREDGCALAVRLWGIGGQCRPVDVNGTAVGVVTVAAEDRGFDQWAAYKRADGTVVFVAQARTYTETGKPGLAQQPFTVEQLAALATDERFDLE